MGNRAVFWGTVRMAERKKRCAGNGENVVCLQPLSQLADYLPITQGSLWQQPSRKQAAAQAFPLERKVPVAGERKVGGERCRFI